MVELESEGQVTRNEVATFLHEFADELEDGIGDVVGEHDESASSDPAGTVTGEQRQDRMASDDTDDEFRRDERSDTDDEFDRDEESETDDVATGDRKRITVIVGGDSATVTVPDRMEFDVEVASRSPMLGSGVNQGIEFDLSWKIDDPDDIREEWLEVE